MPELPDVEIFKRYADATVLHKTIASVHVHAPEMLASVSRQAVAGRLNGRRFESTDRHGKYLFLRTGGTWSLVLHFGMTGTLAYAKSPDADAYHVRLTIGFDNGYRLDYR